MKFTIPGAPIALQRARMGRNGFYDPQKHTKIAMQIYLSHYEGPLLEGPHFLVAYFYMPIPKTASKRRVQELKGSYHTIKPDADNLGKWILDFCQLSGNVFKDDAIISGMLFFKLWEENDKARTEFEFVPMKDQTMAEIISRVIRF